MTAAAITGIGVLSPLGIGAEAFADGLVLGPAPFRRRALVGGRLPDSPPLDVALLDDFDPATVLERKGLRTLGTESKLALAAAALACADAGLDPTGWDGADVGVFASTAFAGLADYVALFADGVAEGPDGVNPAQGPQTGFNAPASQLSIRVRAQGPNLTFANGSAGGLDALAAAAEFVAEGRVGTALVLGVDAIAAPAAHMLARSGTSSPPRPFDRARDGTAYAEAAAVLVVEPAGAASRRHARVHGLVRSAAAAFEPDGRLDEAGRRSLREALERAQAAPDDLAAVFAGANGSVEGDAAEARALGEVIGPACPVCAPKGAAGESFGAAGVIEVAAALLALRCGEVPPTHGFVEGDPTLPPLAVSHERQRPRTGLVLVHAWDPGGAAATAVFELTDAA
jgi:3-oxoacyl-(acyl-carrier-protein) synthase